MVEALQRRLDDWVSRRLPRQREITLNQRRIFIVPSKTAFGLLSIIILLFVLGINFQNSLVYAVCFWLLAMLLVNIFYTYRNLSGLSIRAIGIEPCFAGEMAVLEVELSCPEKQRKFALELAWPDEDHTQTNLVTTRTARVKLSHATARRGYFRPPRIHVSSRYPTGLAVAWSYVTLEVRGVVYPKPADKSFDTSGESSADEAEDGVEIAGGTSDFGGIRDYRPGDAPKRIHWKKYAGNGSLYTREFVDYSSHELWLDWASLPMPGVELRLSHLCRKVLELHQAQQSFGLRLPDQLIEPNKGDAHRERCLRALALFGATHE